MGRMLTTYHWDRGGWVKSHGWPGCLEPDPQSYEEMARGWIWWGHWFLVDLWSISRYLSIDGWSIFFLFLTCFSCAVAGWSIPWPSQWWTSWGKREDLPILQQVYRWQTKQPSILKHPQATKLWARWISADKGILTRLTQNFSDAQIYCLEHVCSMHMEDFQHPVLSNSWW